MIMMMQKGFAPIFILIGILIIVAGGVLLYTNYSNNRTKSTYQDPVLTPTAIPSTTFEVATIKDLITNRTQFDSKRVLIRGKFKKLSIPQPMCILTGSGNNPQIRDEYKVYPSTWAISDGKDTLGVDVIDQNISTSTLPNYKEGEEIELKGIAKATTIQDSCSRDIRFKSIYLEIKAEDIDITTRPLPKSPSTL